MLFNIEITPSNPISSCLILPVFEDKPRTEFDGQLGQTLLLYLQTQRVLLVGCGKKETWNTASFLKMIRGMCAALLKTNAKDALFYLPENSKDYYWYIRQTVECLEDALYTFKPQKRANALKQLTFHAKTSKEITQGKLAIQHGQAIASGITLAKNLGNLSSNICTPSYLAKQAKTLQKEFSAIKTNILEVSDMQKLGMGALLAVAKGSHEPAKLIVTHYQGAKKSSKPIVLVGKGVTFDSGGISIKPSAAMDEMKFDMCGAASVLGTIKAAALLKLPLNLIGIIPATENMPGGQATKPGDVVTSLSGQTIEILNTDAEGRLILCDALTYSEQFKPDVVIDIATLTGAIVITLGSVASGIMGNDQSLTDDLIQAGEYASDRLWPLPLWDDYQELLQSNFADIPNISEGPGAKSITAGCFLARFTKNLRWAHLDIAGTAWKTGREKGATGRPIPLLMQYLFNRCHS